MKHEVVVNAPLQQVVAWHSRPGAIHRLLPPWLPLQVQNESQSLKDGVAELKLFGLIPWTATHLPEKFEPDRRFVDRLTTPGISALLEWNHYHEFSPVSHNKTRVTDTVHARVPNAVLAQNLYYRARQVVGDFAAHDAAAKHTSGPLTVAVTGTTGLIGQALCAMLSTGGHKVVRLVPQPNGDPESRVWDVGNPNSALLEGVDVVVHLADTPQAGLDIAQIDPHMWQASLAKTHQLAKLVGQRAFIVGSSIGVYGPTQSHMVATENSDTGDGETARLVAAWEAASDPARESGARVAYVRTGIVQSPRGGMLAMLRPLFTAGLRPTHTDHERWMSWIGIDDLLDIFLHCIVDASIEGPINAVAPSAIQYGDYEAALRSAVGMPTLFRVPSALSSRILRRCGDIEGIKATARVAPQELTTRDHVFRYPTIESTLRHLLGRMPAQVVPPVLPS